MFYIYIIIGVGVIGAIVWMIRRQRSLKLRAHLMQEAIRNHDFTFRLPTNGLLPGERAMQQTLNQLGETIRQQVNQNEVESWERLTRVLTHEMMNATAPITSISQSLLGRSDVKGTPLEPGIQAIYDTSRHLSDFVANYRKMSQLEQPVLTDVALRPLLDDVCKAYPELSWQIDVPADLVAPRLKASLRGSERRTLYIGNDGLPIPAENRQSLFVPFFTTKRSGSGIGLSLSRRMMIQQGGLLYLAEKQLPGCRAGFILTI